MVRLVLYIPIYLKLLPQGSLDIVCFQEFSRKKKTNKVFLCK